MILQNPGVDALLKLQRSAQPNNMAAVPQQVNGFPLPELMPPLEGMDYQWYAIMALTRTLILIFDRNTAMDGLNDWWRIFNHLGGDVKWNSGPMNPP